MSLFGPPSLFKPKFLDGFKIARMFRGLHSAESPPGQYLENIDVRAAIERLEVFCRDDPKDWLARYFLGDFYITARIFDKALRVLIVAYTLRPRDPRSTYALATAYRQLAHASLEGHRLTEIFPRSALLQLRLEDPDAFRLMMMGKVGIDPRASADSLEKLELTIDHVAQKSIEYFEETLRLGVRANERIEVNKTLQRMYAEYPHLESKVKSKRQADTGLFGEARKGADGIFNDAMGHYTRLRYLFDAPARFRYELGEVIRLCQWAVAADKKLGDAYVLLANGYSLLDGHVQASGLEPDHYFRWAGALIQHWFDTPLRNYPFTKNKEIAEELLTRIISRVATANSIGEREAKAVMRQWANEYLVQALSPTSFALIKEQLSAEPV